MPADDWTYEPAPDLDKTLAERLRGFPREPDMLVYAARSVAALAMRAWLRVWHRLRIEGRERLPREGSYVLVANHSSHLDALSLLAAVPLARLHRAFPAAAADYFFERLPRVAFSAVVVNALPFHREVHQRQSLELCRRLLETPGNVLILFPEGTRSKGGEVGAFRPGVGLLVAGTSVPVVPCHIRGAHAAWPKGAWIPRPWKVCVRIGKPRTFEGVERSKAGAVRVVEDLRSSVLDLAGS